MDYETDFKPLTIQEKQQRLKISQRKYYNNNREAINRQRLIYKKQYNNKPFNCDCGAFIKLGSKCSHLKSQLHMNRLEKLINDIDPDTPKGLVKKSCLCGGSYLARNKKQHLTCKRHINFIKSNSNQDEEDYNYSENETDYSENEEDLIETNSNQDENEEDLIETNSNQDEIEEDLIENNEPNEPIYITYTQGSNPNWLNYSSLIDL